jgi:hypothetical protein
MLLADYAGCAGRVILPKGFLPRIAYQLSRKGGLR